ncbi:NtaA/DmoA family FMN-dependent monooxygenase [Lacicoccus alkaliphilus]|uniref:FMN-dependent oxidoreductase, nitrilotriacetate monooxygenase family n=1 Tax=Lacicoccus alkaliphilus DSM 16010 TaxID=1123231 RepID=A0A1M7KNE0_9BACL|nr:NtaA/DmoA family FMN-dependent monooxygenase [Salinicoccus alkaliphilus]SHM66493.1 FMN-dependent oxidoreductase, nitrilotriacetate monooxygenase family [Salinicoccus alkaliphilus DSM 16010]
MNHSKELNIGVLLYGVGHHQAAWLEEDSSINEFITIEYYENLARIAERGKLDAVFFADSQAFPAYSATELPTSYFDPLIALTAMSKVTDNVGLVSTISGTFNNPFTSARQLLSLHHITKGRAGWNLVTSMTHREAQNHSMSELPGRTVRYKKADEFAAVMDQLFESWSLEHYKPDRINKEIIKNESIQPFNYKGHNFQIKGPLTLPLGKAGKPVAMQAGTSMEGVALAAKYADAVYSVSWNLKQAKAYRNKLNEAIKASHRPEANIKVFPGLVTYVGRTKEEAWKKKLKLDGLLPIDSTLDQLEFFIQRDTTSWDLDEKVPPLPSVEEFTGPIGRYQTVLEIIEDKNPTVRELIGYLSAGGGHLTLIGTPREIVDEMEKWMNEGVADGFNLMPPTLPGGLEDFVDLIIPEMQNRGLFRKDYNGETFREMLALY